MEQDTKIKILVVEDDISLKDSLVRLLQNRDFLVQAVENKQQAVEQIKSGQQYDIYLLDVWLPIRQWENFTGDCDVSDFM